MNLLTSLSPLSGVPITPPGGTPLPEAGRGSRALRPPRGFHPPSGGFRDVRLAGHSPVGRGRTVAQKMGLRYEQRVHDVLSAIYDERYRQSPSILFHDLYGHRRAIPDGLLAIDDHLVIVEVKYTHCELAWWQLKRLYSPLLVTLYPGRRIRHVEICRSYDPSVVFPGDHRLVTSLHSLPETEVGVIQWKL